MTDERDVPTAPQDERDISEALRDYVATELNAKKNQFGEKFVLYIPNQGLPEGVDPDVYSKLPENERNLKQIEIPNWRRWAKEALFKLGQINHGATSNASANGIFFDTDDGEPTQERTILVYSFVERERFRDRFMQVVKFVYKFATQTRQLAIYFEFDSFAYQIEPPYSDLKTRIDAWEAEQKRKVQGI